MLSTLLLGRAKVPLGSVLGQECRLAGANFNPGRYHPDGSVIGRYAYLFINTAYTPTRAFFIVISYH